MFDCEFVCNTERLSDSFLPPPRNITLCKAETKKGGRAVGNKFPVPSRSSSDPLSCPVYSDSVLSAYLLTLLPTVPPSGYSINLLVK